MKTLEVERHWIDALGQFYAQQNLGFRVKRKALFR